MPPLASLNGNSTRVQFSESPNGLDPLLLCWDLVNVNSWIYLVHLVYICAIFVDRFVCESCVKLKVGQLLYCCAFQFLIVIFCKLEILAMGLWSSERRNACKRASSPALYHHHHKMFPARQRHSSKKNHPNKP